MKYYDTKYKIREIWSNAGKVKADIPEEESKVEKIKNNLILIDRPIHAFKRIFTYETDWEDITTILPNQTMWYYKEYNITIQELHEKFIPFIRFAIVYKHEDLFIDTDKKTPFEINTFYTNHVFQITDLYEEDDDGNRVVIADIKKVKLSAFIELRSATSDRYPIETKIIIKFFNPECYV